MKQLSLILCILLFTQIGKSQHYKIESGSELTNADPNGIWTESLGQDESGYYFIRKNGPVTNEGIILEKYDTSFQFLFSKDIESSSGVLGDSRNHFETILGNNEIFIFLASWNKEKMEGGLWVERLSIDGEKIDEAVELLAHKEQSMMKSSEYRVSISEDGSKLAVLTEPTFDKNAKEHFSISVFNTTDYKLIAENHFTFPLEMQRYPRNQLFVNNNGVAYAFKEVRLSKKDFRYFITSTSANDSFQEELIFEDKRLNHDKFIVDKHGDLVGVGLVAESKKFNTLWQELWTFKLSENTIKCSKVDPIGSDILVSFMSEKKAAKEGSSLNYFYIKDLLEKPDGGYVLLTEKLDERKTALPSEPNQAISYSYKFRYGSIIAISIDKNCSRNWASVIDKGQEFETTKPEMELGSFAYGIAQNDLHIIWNFTELYVIVNYANRFWKDKSGDKVRVKDVFGENARHPTFLNSINLSDGSSKYPDRTFSALPLKEIQMENNFAMAVDPSYFFSSKNGLVLFSRMDDAFPKKFKFSRITFY